MAGVPLTFQVTDGVLAFHGSPTDGLVYLLSAGTPICSGPCNCPPAQSAEFRTVDYDWDQAAAIAEANGRPDVAGALRTGRV
jgi:hypothetical protein